MDDDKFGDPRLRSKRGRGRGGRGRGRGRGRGGLQVPGGASKKVVDLGSNSYRFEASEHDEDGGDEESAYDVGLDFEEVADAVAAGHGERGIAGVADDNVDESKMQNDILSDLVVDFVKLEGVLATAPLWVRLGEDARFALGVPSSVRLGNLLDENDYSGDGHEVDKPPVETNKPVDDTGDKSATSEKIKERGETNLLGDIAALELDDECDDDEHDGFAEVPQAKDSKSGDDDFDKWLDGL